MYKDKDKQREANRAAKARFKAKQGIPVEQGIPGIPEQGIPPDVQATINRLTTNQDGTVDEQARANRMAIAKTYQRQHPDRYYSTGLGCMPVSNPVPVKVSLPGDDDYLPMCDYTRAWVKERVMAC